MTLIIVSMTSAARSRFQYPLYLGQNQTSHANRALCYYKGTEIFDGQWVNIDGPPVSTRSYICTGVTVNADQTQGIFYRNGTQTQVSGLAPEFGKARFESLSSGITLGAATDPVCGWIGDIAEVLVFDRQISSAEMKIVSAALSQKYGLDKSAAPAQTPP